MACLTIALMPNMACSDLDNREAEQVSNSGLFARTASEIDGEYLYNARNIIVNELIENTTLFEDLRNPVENSDGTMTYINQQNFDFLTELIDFEGNIDLGQTNKIISEIFKAKDQGFVDYFQSSGDMSASAKNIIVDFLSEERTYQTLQEYPNFNLLTASEKESFRLADETLLSARTNSNSADTGVFILTVVPCILIGSYIGGWIG